MATSTSPDNIYKPQGGDWLTLGQIFNALADSIQNAFGNRQMYTFRATNEASLPTSGMRSGDECFLTSNGETWKHLGGAWKLWHKPRTAFTPTGVGYTLGNGTIEAEWFVNAGKATMSVRLGLGSSSSITGDLQINLPVPSIETRVGFIGGARMTDSSMNRVSIGSGLISSNTNRFIMRCILTDATSTNFGLVYTFSPTVPFTWNTGDSVEGSCSWLL